MSVCVCLSVCVCVFFLAFPAAGLLLVTFPSAAGAVDATQLLLLPLLLSGCGVREW
jgi:hypothetical protein